LVAACWLSAGSTPFVDAVVGTAEPADWARDYVTARARLEDGRGTAPAAAEGNERAVRYGAPRVALLGAPYFIHPPTATLAVLPFACLPWRAAALAWAAGSLIALVWLAFSLLGIWAAGEVPPASRVALLTLALTLWPPALYCLEKGQWSIWLAALLAAGWRSWEGRRAGRAGGLFGVAAALKLTPIVVVGHLLLSRNRRAAAATLLTAGGAALVALVAIGPAAWHRFATDLSSNEVAWAPWLANSASLDGIYARLLTSNPFSRPVVVAPAVARLAFTVTALLLLAVAIGATYRRRDRSSQAQARVLAAWLTLPVLLNPLGWSHVLMLLLAPLAVLGRTAGPRERVAAILVLAAISVPPQRLIEWAGAVPVGPGASVLLGWHAFAALALFGALLASDEAPLRAPVSAR
jgi:alpha-1,2-mannosyltransferase